jgi:hypothetical protein
MMSTKAIRVALGLVLALALAASVAAAPDERAQPSFSSPDDAVAAMVGAMRRQLPGVLATIVGPGSQAWLLSGDDVADRAAMTKFVAAYDARHAITVPR